MGDSHYIKAGWMVDGTGGQIQENILLTVERGRFCRIEKIEDSDAPGDAGVTDLSDCTIFPPLIDCHVHLCLSGKTDNQIRKSQLSASFEEQHTCISAQLRHHISSGVLAVRDGGDRRGFTLLYTNEASGTKQVPVIVKTAGRAWHQKGRYGAWTGRHPEEGESLAVAFTKESEPIDHVKLINSGLNSLSVFGKETLPQFELKEIKDLVYQAAQQGKKVMAHANGKLPVRLAIDAGCHSIEHGFFMGRENLERMAEAQTIWVPTAFTMKAFAKSIDPENSQAVKEIIERNLHHQLEQMAMARQCGATIALGTDAGSPGVRHGDSAIEELKLFMAAGYSLPEAVRCATQNGAQLLGLEEFGLIAKGKPAQFIAAQATPSMLFGKSSYPQQIYISGQAWNPMY